MPAASAYDTFKAALITRLQARPALADVNVLYRVPINQDDIITPSGTREAIWVGGAEGTDDDVVFCAGDLRFDETYEQEVGIEVLGTSSGDTQATVDARLNELLFEVLADIAAQLDWDFAALDLDVYDYLWFSPRRKRWTGGRLQQTGVFAGGLELFIEVRARRTFS